MTKISIYVSLESIYIIDISIYLDLPARGTDKQMYRMSIVRIISIICKYKESHGSLISPPSGERELTIDRRQTDRQTDKWEIESLI